MRHLRVSLGGTKRALLLKACVSDSASVERPSEEEGLADCLIV